MKVFAFDTSENNILNWTQASQSLRKECSLIIYSEISIIIFIRGICSWRRSRLLADIGWDTIPDIVYRTSGQARKKVNRWTTGNFCVLNLSILQSVFHQTFLKCWLCRSWTCSSSVAWRKCGNGCVRIYMYVNPMLAFGLPNLLSPSEIFVSLSPFYSS